jgi:hypothetical protein
VPTCVLRGGGRRRRVADGPGAGRGGWLRRGAVNKSIPTTHVPQKLTGLSSLFTNPVSILSAPIQTVPKKPLTHLSASGGIGRKAFVRAQVSSRGRDRPSPRGSCDSA